MRVPVRTAGRGCFVMYSIPNMKGLRVHHVQRCRQRNRHVGGAYNAGPFSEESAVDLKLSIVIMDEMSDEVVRARGMLDLASGDIYEVVHEDYDVAAQGLPAEREDYEFSCGVLSNGSKEVEFRVEVVSGRYSVTPSELLELKGRAAKLFTAPPGTSTR